MIAKIKAKTSETTYLIRNEGELRDFVETRFGVRIPDVQVCEHHTTPWRAFSDAYFCVYPDAVWYASRGFGGKSFLLALLTLTEAVTLKADATVLGASGEQSKRVHDHMTRFWYYEDAPQEVLRADPGTTKTALIWGNTIHALTASQKSVRGPHPQRLRMDEIDEMDIMILDAAKGQPMRSGEIMPQTVMSSTRQNVGGTMDIILERAARKGWGVYEWCYRENLEPHGWLTQEEVTAKRNEVTLEMWNAEYENQDPNPGARAIDTQAVEQMFKASLGEYAGDVNEYIEIEEPDEKGIYATGTDWAKKQDWTIIETLRVDCNPAKVVAWERTGRLDWPKMVAMHEDRVRRYKGKGAHDATGIGDVINDYLNEPSTPIIMAGKERSQMLTRYITACEHGEIESPMIRHAYSEHKFASNDDVFRSGETFHLPDSIAAGAIAWSNYKRAGVKPPQQNQNRNPMHKAFPGR